MLLALAALLGAARIFLPTAVRWYVNRVIDRSPLYDGSVGDIDLYLWRGAYSIEDVRIVKTTGNVPVPLFASPRVDFSLQWDALLHRKLVGQITMHRPQLNFVDGQSQGEDQTGAGGPWLEIIRDLFPFRINSAELHDASIHFRAFDTDPPVDVYLGELRATITNLTNIYDEVTPLVATVNANGLAMDQARFEYVMKLDPFSYRPTFELAIRLLGLDVTRTNALARAYGAFDFERGWFDLVVELNASEGQVKGYVKPLFRNLKVLSLRRDIPEDNVLEVFWEALVGITTELLENQPRDQFGTMISLRGDLTDPDTNLLEIIGNILRNAFIRAYLPRLQGTATQIDWLQFSPAQVSDPDYLGD
ncbi:DUF748 domain-containing protein [Fontivita pretiosa]|uniref:DUF748 domain-containing protein n=1 Tax=Fontivita pretiosa TaxID=2989684 RepID=UPI003D182D14